MENKSQVDLLSFMRQNDKAVVTFKGVEGNGELEFITHRPSNPFGDIVEIIIPTEKLRILIEDFLRHGRGMVTEGEIPYSVTLTLRLTPQGLTLETRENDSSAVPAVYTLHGHGNIRQRVVIKMLLRQALQRISTL